ncbi:hypothetical protein [Methyloversatilis sp.]|uniref:hypothetical protein n=1 Tax=Methyloversatilis sp. TaxID=2569862 RepID=UPI0027BACBD1|nr:hypothetical protein [Methyloversatilis sp.]
MKPADKKTDEKKPASRRLFSFRSEELLLHFFSGSLGSIGSSINGFAGSLGSFASGVGCGGSSVGRGSGGIGGRGGSSISGSSSRGCSSVSRGGGRSGFGNRSRCFFRLRASGESQGEQGGGEEGLFHFDFLG